MRKHIQWMIRDELVGKYLKAIRRDGATEHFAKFRPGKIQNTRTAPEGVYLTVKDNEAETLVQFTDELEYCEPKKHLTVAEQFNQKSYWLATLQWKDGGMGVFKMMFEYNHLYPLADETEMKLGAIEREGGTATLHLIDLERCADKETIQQYIRTNSVR